jgi:hypothetical protein
MNSLPFIELDKWLDRQLEYEKIQRKRRSKFTGEDDE